MQIGDRKLTPDQTLALAGIILTLVGIFIAIAIQLYTNELRRSLDTLVRSPWFYLSVVMALALFFVTYFLFKVKRLQAELVTSQQEVARIKGDLEKGAQRIPQTPLTPKFGRWEQIRKVVYGHVDYFPFLYYDRPDDLPVGIGVRVLEELFGGSRALLHWPRKSSWDDMIDGLVKKSFDIIATPLFETNERSGLVAFSAPIFFADVGLYMKKDYLRGITQNSFTFGEAIDRLRTDHGDRLQLEVIEGELSQKMATKHLKLPIKQQTILKRHQSSIQYLIKGLVDYSRPADVVFAERFVAELTTEVKNGEVINILKHGELLYPVGFAMRREDYILRNFINIRLMELHDAMPERIFSFIVEELNKHQGFRGIDVKTAKSYFVRSKPL